MTTQTRSWIGLVVVIGVLLSGAYLIVVSNSPALSSSSAATPVGVFH